MHFSCYCDGVGLDATHSSFADRNAVTVVADFAPTGEMLLTMQPVLRILNPATAGATTAIDFATRQRCAKRVRWGMLKVVAAIGMLQFALCAVQAQGQAPDNGGCLRKAPSRCRSRPRP